MTGLAFFYSAGQSLSFRVFGTFTCNIIIDMIGLIPARSLNVFY